MEDERHPLALRCPELLWKAACLCETKATKVTRGHPLKDSDTAAPCASAQRMGLTSSRTLPKRIFSANSFPWPPRPSQLMVAACSVPPHLNYQWRGATCLHKHLDNFCRLLISYILPIVCTRGPSTKASSLHSRVYSSDCELLTVPSNNTLSECHTPR